MGILIRVRAWVHPQFGAEFDHRFVSREAAKDVRRKSCMDFLRLGVRKIFRQRNSDFFVASRETNFSAADSRQQIALRGCIRKMIRPSTCNLRRRADAPARCCASSSVLSAVHRKPRMIMIRGELHGIVFRGVRSAESAAHVVFGALVLRQREYAICFAEFDHLSGSVVAHHHHDGVVACS